MAFIQNVSYTSFESGMHRAPRFNSVAIQILNKDRDDFGAEGDQVKWPISPFTFKEIYKFRLEDIDSSEAISDEDAKQIAGILLNAYKNDQDVIVHCAAGISRSGAVCEVGTIIGFDDTHAFRLPNITIKSKILQHLKQSNFD
jgi:predicted protein tyrosine phosphatase